jgi:hypothetical protein
MGTCLRESEVTAISRERPFKLLQNSLVRLLALRLVLNELLARRQFLFIVKAAKVDFNVASGLQVIFLEAWVGFFKTWLVETLLVLGFGVLLHVVLLDARESPAAISILHCAIIHFVEIIVTRACLR